jgi:hypothetical protein
LAGTGHLAERAPKDKAPHKSRTLIKLDLTALGAGQVVTDQRFDGVTGYVVDTFNGNRAITGVRHNTEIDDTSFVRPAAQ